MAMSAKVALVTGGASGIGAAACVEFARNGCIVVAADRDGQGLLRSKEAVNRVAGNNGSTCFTADVSNEAEVKALMHCICEQYGRLHYCFNNAGIEGDRALVQDYPTDMFDKVMATNVRGVFLCLKHQIPLMLATAGGQGAIVITSSTAGVSGMAEFGAYSASKHALVGLMRSAAAEYAPKGIRINCINPATTDTPMVARFAEKWPEWQAATNATYPLGRIATAQEVAEAAVWLCTKAGFMTGQTLVLDGGASCC